MRRDSVLRRLLAVADVVAAVVAVSVALPLVGQNAPAPRAVLALPLLVLIGKVVGLYDRDERLLNKTTLSEGPALFQVATLYTLLILVAEPLLVRENLDRGQTVALWALLFVALVAARWLARALAKRLLHPERCLVLGNAANAQRLSEKMDRSYTVCAVVVGRVPLEPEPDDRGGIPVVGNLMNLGATLAELDVHRVVIAPRSLDSEEMLDALRLVKSFGVKVSVLPRLFEVVGSSVEFDNLDGLMLLGVPKTGLSTSSRFLKRAMDLVGSLVGLVALGPVIGSIALAIRLDSPGPVFFRQRRVGCGDREFEILKFRTMCDGADARQAGLRGLNQAGEGLFKIPDDPRLTRVGRFLRRSSLDELPQLFNVLRGDMSLVGPRPLVPDEDSQVLGWQRDRLRLKPGMTGLWQIFGSSRIPLHEMVKIDYLYTAQWSLWTDITTLLRTVPHMLSRRGA
jgi:exopolysaccharide biosynthesis polyprenyl glycosylphosphotransferase